MSEPVPARLRGTVVTVFVVGLALGSCISRAPFACDDDIECQRDGSNGTCAAPGYCAHRDDECPSGLRFGRFAAELAETCVEVLAEGSGSSVGSTGGPRSTDSGDASTSSSSGEPPAPPEICDGIDNDGDGLVDEWSMVNDQCNGCDLHQDRDTAYWLCPHEHWYDAQAQCQQLGANLVTIEDFDENSFLSFLLPEATWIGINDLEQQGVYDWVDGSDSRYRYWVDDSAPPASSESDCGGMVTGGRWTIFGCLNQRPSFCEAPHIE